LSPLKKLQKLYLNETSISDISPLAGLTELRELDLSVNAGLKNISPLQNLTKLDKLKFDQAGVEDISALGGLVNLEELSAFSNSISDISALSSLTNLTELTLEANQISDISALSSLKKLSTLDLDKNSISDIFALSKLTSLQNIYLNNNRIKNISALSTRNRIQYLYLQNNFIWDISPIAGLQSPSRVYVSGNYLNLGEGTETKGIINTLNSRSGVTVTTGTQKALSQTPFESRADANGEGQLKLSWDRVPDATYEVTRTRGGKTVNITLGSNTDTSFTDTGLKPGCTYDYVIKARIWQGNGKPQAVAQSFVSGTTGRRYA